MARYFFNYAPGLPFDEEGEEHKSLDDARLVADHTAKEMTRGRTAVLADERIVVTDEQGKPFTVRYEEVNAMLLNEFLKEHRKGEQQDRKIEELEATVAKLQSVLKEQAEQIRKVNDKVEMNRSTQQMVVNDR